ncbi:MAG: hydroxymethylbilane synthase, partial [Methanobacteriota archaeon]
RRRAQLLARWPELDVIDLRGNVGTRLRRLGAKEFDAIVVAAAGVERLKIRGWPAEPLPPDVMTPAPGQGALALEARADDGTVLGILASADDPAARTATQAERALSVLVGADCNVPFGALATVEDASIALRAVVAAPDGRRVVRAVAKGPAMDWGGVVDEARGRLFDGGAREILREMA